MYEYRAFCTNVIDGDTVDVEIQLGFNIKVTKRLRLAGVNAYETRLGRGTTIAEKAKGHEAKILVSGFMKDQWVTIRTKRDKTGKYGRVIADIILPENRGSLAKLLVDRGLAVYYDYNKPRT